MEVSYEYVGLVRWWTAQPDIWTMLTAVGTVGAVVAALFAGLWQRRQEVRRAKVLYPAIADEFLWYATTAESVLKYVLTYTEHRASFQKVEAARQGLRLYEKFTTFDLLAIGDYEFPVFNAFADAFRLGHSGIAEDVTSAFGTILRAQHALRSQLQGMSSVPNSEQLAAYRTAASAVMMSAQVAYRLLAHRTRQPIPPEWDPKLPTQLQ